MKHSEVPRKWAFSASKTPEKFSRSDTHLCRFRTIRRLRTGGPTNGWALSHSSSSDSSVPGIANGLTLRSGRPWFFANRLIESSLSPKSLASSGSCNHRFVPIFRGIILGIICQLFPFPRCDPNWSRIGLLAVRIWSRTFYFTNSQKIRVLFQLHKS